MAGLKATFDQWRSSTLFIVASMTIAISSDLFLYAFVVPILPYILRVRVGLPRSDIQLASSNLLAFYGGAMVILSPVCGALASRFPNRKRPLLIALTAQLVSTAFSAASTTLPLLYLGRIFQGVSACTIWSVGMATVTDTVDSKHLGVTMGIITPFITAGNFIGPMVSGLLLSAAGYWPAWSAALAICVLDIFTRLIMKEKPRPAPAPTPAPEPLSAPPLNPSTSNPSASSSTRKTSTSLPSPSTSPSTPILPPPLAKPFSSAQLYTYLLTHRRTLSPLLLLLTNSLLLSSIDATLPLHVLQTFHWPPSLAGLMYLSLLGPGLLLSPLFGHLRDRVSPRFPAAIGFLLETLALLAMGAAGHSRLPWTQGRAGEVMYVVAGSVLSVGMEASAGVAGLEGVRVLERLESERPGVLGVEGGMANMWALASMWYTMGSAVGPYVGGWGVLKVGYGGMCAFMAGLCLLSSIIALVFVGKRGKEQPFVNVDGGVEDMENGPTVQRQPTNRTRIHDDIDDETTALLH